MKSGWKGSILELTSRVPRHIWVIFDWSSSLDPLVEAITMERFSPPPKAPARVER